MVGKTHDHSDKILALFTNQITPGAAVVTNPIYIGLFTTDPDDDYTLASPTGVEAVYGAGNDRMIVTGPTDWSARADGTVGRETQINKAITWTDWQGTSPSVITSFGMFTDTVAGGTGELLYWATLMNSRSIETGESATFDPDTIVVRED